MITVKQCPRGKKCASGNGKVGVVANGLPAIEQLFGFRKMKPGGERTPQTWCRACRSEDSKERRQAQKLVDQAIDEAIARHTQSASSATNGAKPVPAPVAGLYPAYRGLGHHAAGEGVYLGLKPYVVGSDGSLTAI